MANSEHDRLRKAFRWPAVGAFNIGVACADAQPSGDLALIEIGVKGNERRYTFGDISHLSNRLANALVALGVSQGDRVALVLPQRAETAIAHLALYKVGAVVVPMSALFGQEALKHRLADSGTRLVVTDDECLERVLVVARELEGIVVATVDGHVAAPVLDFHNLIAGGSGLFDTAPTDPDAPALLIYTSGTTGQSKGALLAHRTLLGHLPGFQYSHDRFPHEGDLFWTPADWAWIGGLMDALLPSWFHGRPVLSARRCRFDPEWAVDAIVQNGVRNVFLPPTALRMMTNAGVSLPKGALRSAGSGGEALGSQTSAWAVESLSVIVNEFYGQTEANLLVGNSHFLWDVRSGSMGLPYPGHDVRVLREDGSPADPGETAEICVRAPDPVFFLGYWGRDDATAAKFRGAWLRTGDLAQTDEDGYFWFLSRSDDVISSAGYRIGPEEIEGCLMQHSAISVAGVIGVADELRGEVIKAFIQLAPGHVASRALETEIKDFVRTRLAAYEYPRQFEFVDEIPLTVTGKIRRNALRNLHAVVQEAESTNPASMNQALMNRHEIEG